MAKKSRDKAGKFKQGHPGFKPKGSISKLNSELRQTIGNFLESHWPTIESDFLKLEPKERVTLYEKLLSHCLPRLQSIEVQSEFDIKRFLNAGFEERIEMIEQFNNAEND